MLFHLHWLPFTVIKRRILLFFSDSMSSLEAISGFKLEIDIVQNIIKDYTHLANRRKTIILCWIPSGPVMAIRGLTLQQNQLFVARYKYEASST